MKIYEVGGSVRDLFIRQTTKDVDYAVESCSYDEMKHELIQHGVIIIHERPEFGSLKGRLKGKVVDFTLCRTEGTYEDFRHPSSIQASTIETDLQRRDFTMNAMAIPCHWDVNNELVPSGDILNLEVGIRSIDNKIIECVGDTKERMFIFTSFASTSGVTTFPRVNKIPSTVRFDTRKSRPGIIVFFTMFPYE